MERLTDNTLERERIAKFLTLSANYIGVKPPSAQTFARWTAACSCHRPQPQLPQNG